jgi:sialate O-acetylesterase
MSDFQLHPLFSSDALLQRDRVIPIWGKASPNTKVQILLAERQTTTISDGKGDWIAHIGPFEAGIGHQLVVSTPDETITRENIAFGDVWLCSGQSNMEWQLFSGPPVPVNNAEEEARNANYPAIRFLTIPHVSAITPQKSFDATWKVCDPESVKNISAVGYFFGREIHQQVGVPIGLIDASWSGTSAQVWASGEALQEMPDFTEWLEAVKNTREDVPYSLQYDDYLRANDLGMQEEWFREEWDTSDWVQLGENELKLDNGTAWFTQHISLDEADTQVDALTLRVASLVNTDAVYWNGEKLREVGRYDGGREYAIPVSLLQLGENKLVIRVFVYGGSSPVAAEGAVQLLFGDGRTVTMGEGRKVKLSSIFEEMPIPPVDVEAYPIAPSVLFNSMISPLLPYAIKGTIWYQGETNASKPKQYEVLLPTLIADWRARFNSGQFPFYLVQLAGYGVRDEYAGASFGGWPPFRESQEIIAGQVENSGFAVALDVGDEVEIHPRNKQDVGKRLALLALKNDYQQNIITSGPALKSSRSDGENFIVELENVGGELITKGDINKTFILADAEQKWAWGHIISIESNTNTVRVTLNAPEIGAPVAVRYGWANFPLGHIYNQAGLPAAPFRSDEW